MEDWQILLLLICGVWFAAYTWDVIKVVVREMRK